MWLSLWVRVCPTKRIHRLLTVEDLWIKRLAANILNKQPYTSTDGGRQDRVGGTAIFISK